MPSRLGALDPLVGRWREEVSFGGKTYRADATFEWLDGDGGFLVWRVTSPAPFPSSVSVIGEDGESLAMHYFDTRGVYRVYRMTLRGDEWRIWRHHRGFSQRLFGTLSKDRRRIDARWEKNEDDRGWALDFPLTYRRVGRVTRSAPRAGRKRTDLPAAPDSRRGRAIRPRSRSGGRARGTTR